MKKFYSISFFIFSMMVLFTGIMLITSATGTSTINKKSASTDDYVDPGFKKLVQVAIVVRDIEASSKRWAAFLGMPVPEIRTTRPGNDVDVIYRGKPSNGQVKLTFFVLGDVVIELLEPVTDGTAWYEYLDEHGEGVQHLGFQVEDQERTIRALEAAGYPVIHRGRYDSDDGTYIYYDTEDALGVVVESLHSDQ